MISNSVKFQVLGVIDGAKGGLRMFLNRRRQAASPIRNFMFLFSNEASILLLANVLANR
jgi:hypothetical protein